MMKILVSPGFGSGWSTWADGKLTDPTSPKRIALTWKPLIDFIEEGGDREKLSEDHPAIAGLLAITKDSEDDANRVYVGSNVHDLIVVKLKRGTSFTIREYDGAESVDTGEGFIVAT